MWVECELDRGWGLAKSVERAERVTGMASRPVAARKVTDFAAGVETLHHLRWPHFLGNISP
jgi:hypothetical protein